MNVYAVPPVGPQPASGWDAPSLSAPKRVGGLATALTVLLAIIAALAALIAVVLLYRASLLRGVLDGTTLDQQAAQSVDAVVTVLNVLYLVLYLAIGVVFITWQYRHGKNARLLGQERGLGPGWAIGGWFIPIANYVLPAMQIFGASRHSDPEVVGVADARGRGARIVIPWAITLFLGSNLVFTNDLAEPSGSYEDSVRTFLAADQISAAGQVLMIAAAALAIVMVRSLSSRQEPALEARPVGRRPGSPVTRCGLRHRLHRSLPGLCRAQQSRPGTPLLSTKPRPPRRYLRNDPLHRSEFQLDGSGAHSPVPQRW
ncbi:MAG: DUF4328 domain-containing protein [Jiangellaceae bacterium]